MTKPKQEQFGRYESLRLQLADVARRFVEVGKHFPTVHFQFLQADRSMGRSGWSSWIDANRTADTNHETWDVYPSTWSSDDWSLDELESREGLVSQFAGVFRSSLGNVQQAQSEFERLAVCGSKILIALKEECATHKRFTAHAAFTYVCPGCRGWLDAVRNTAELHRSAYLNVNSGIWGVADDELSVVRAMGRSMSMATAELESGKSPTIGVFASEISPDIFAASANAIRLWLQGEMSEQIDAQTMYQDITPIKLAGSTKPDPALEALKIEDGSRAAPRLAPRSKKKNERGRPSPDAATLKDEQRVFDGWSKARYGTFKNYALELKRDVSEVTAIMERVRKRHRR